MITRIETENYILYAGPGLIKQVDNLVKKEYRRAAKQIAVEDKKKLKHKQNGTIHS